MKEIQFISNRRKFLILSALCITITVIVLIINKGVNLGLDFTGGTLIQIRTTNKEMDIAMLRKILATYGYTKGVELQNIFTGTNEVKEFLIRFKFQQKDTLAAEIENIFKNSNILCEILRVEYVGPTIGKHLTKRALYAIIFSLIGIIIYVGLRFGSSIWGIMGVVALAHDVFLTIGFLTLLGKEITLTVIAALLTLAGYSINDTIVIFDRIRENIRIMRKESLERIMNLSINQTLTRTLLTSGTTLAAVLALYILGNQVIKDFALSLIFGVIIGTYSSIFVASSLVLEYNLTKGKK
ncbi:MAG: protein translocase subunit SecF [Endomicrobia bacterium]|nr:protein translocase subunit SecF [Endomicrobiia bacterium]MDW8056266.1 protein translocase subunit SecF [Elusimicrobiota bacterium]